MDGGGAWVPTKRLDGSHRDASSVAPAVHGDHALDCGSMGGARRWYAVAAKHRQERAAALAVQALGYSFFLPMIPVIVPASGGIDLRPMFAPYLFVEFDVARDPWGEIKRLPCVQDAGVLYLTDPCRPTPVPVRMLDAVRAVIGKHGVVPDPVAAMVAIGAEVRIIDGPGEGMTGTVERVRRGAREARLAVDGCVLPMWVPADRLALVGG